MAIVIQYAFPDMGADVALTQIGKREYKVPCWMWIEWHGGGIRQLIDEYGLTKYRHQHEEIAAIQSIERKARALRRFYRRGHDRHYYNLLDDMSRHLLRLEQRVMRERPHLRGQARYEWVAEHMPRHYGVFHWRSIQVMLEDATDMLVIDQDRRELRTLSKLVQAIKTADLAEEITETTITALANRGLANAA